MDQNDIQRKHVMKFIRKTTRGMLLSSAVKWYLWGGIAAYALGFLWGVVCRIFNINDLGWMSDYIFLGNAWMLLCALIRVFKGVTYTQGAVFADGYLGLEHKLVTAEQVIREKDFSPAANLVIKQAYDAIGTKFPALRFAKTSSAIIMGLVWIFFFFACQIVATLEIWVMYYNLKTGVDPYPTPPSCQLRRIDATEFERKLLELVKTPADGELVHRAVTAIEVHDHEQFNRIVDMLKQRGIDVKSVMGSSGGLDEPNPTATNPALKELPQTKITPDKADPKVAVYDPRYEPGLSQASLPALPPSDRASNPTQWEQVKLKALENKTSPPADSQTRKIAENYLTP